MGSTFDTWLLVDRERTVLVNLSYVQRIWVKPVDGSWQIDVLMADGSRYVIPRFEIRKEAEDFLLNSGMDWATP